MNWPARKPNNHMSASISSTASLLINMYEHNSRFLSQGAFRHFPHTCASMHGNRLTILMAVNPKPSMPSIPFRLLALMGFSTRFLIH